jgi:uncharacterized lipoprotein YmbA
MKSLGTGLTLLFTLFLLTGCGSSGESPTRYYLIEPVSGVTADSSDLAIEIADLDIPQYLERYQIASRRAGNQLVFATSHQWAENLRKNLMRTLARNLTSYLGSADIGTPANRSSSAPDFSVRIYIERFERDAEGYVQLTARWQLSKGDTRKTLITQSSQFTSANRIDARDYAGTVASMAALFADLSKTISTAIEEAQ